MNLLSELGAALALNALERAGLDIFQRVRNSYFAGLGRVFEMMVIAGRALELPAIGREFLDYFAATVAHVRPRLLCIEYTKNNNVSTGAVRLLMR